MRLIRHVTSDLLDEPAVILIAVSGLHVQRSECHEYRVLNKLI
jgi:hypothetical protein